MTSLSAPIESLFFGIFTILYIGTSCILLLLSSHTNSVYTRSRSADSQQTIVQGIRSTRTVHKTASIVCSTILFVLGAVHWILSLVTSIRRNALISVVQAAIIVSVVLLEDGYSMYICLILWNANRAVFFVLGVFFVGMAVSGFTAVSILLVEHPNLWKYTTVFLVLALVNAALVPGLTTYKAHKLKMSSTMGVTLLTVFMHTLAIAFVLGMYVARTSGAWLLVDCWPSLIGTIFCIRILACKITSPIPWWCSLSQQRPKLSPLMFSVPLPDEESNNNDNTGHVPPLMLVAPTSYKNYDDETNEIETEQTTRSPSSLTYSHRPQSLQKIAQKFGVSIDAACIVDLTRPRPRKVAVEFPPQDVSSGLDVQNVSANNYDEQLPNELSMEVVASLDVDAGGENGVVAPFPAGLERDEDLFEPNLPTGINPNCNDDEKIDLSSRIHNDDDDDSVASSASRYPDSRSTTPSIDEDGADVPADINPSAFSLHNILLENIHLDDTSHSPTQVDNKNFSYWLAATQHFERDAALEEEEWQMEFELEDIVPPVEEEV